MDKVIGILKDIQQQIRDSKICYVSNKKDKGKTLNLVRVSMDLGNCIRLLKVRLGYYSCDELGEEHDWIEELIWFNSHSAHIICKKCGYMKLGW